MEACARAMNASSAGAVHVRARASMHATSVRAGLGTGAAHVFVHVRETGDQGTSMSSKKYL